MYTYYSSFAFIGVSLLATGSWMQSWLSVLGATSILHHAKYYENYPGRELVQIADRTAAHVVGFRALWDLSNVEITPENSMAVMACYTMFAYVAVVYHTYLRNQDRWTLHSTIHYIGAISLWLLHQLQYNKTLYCLRECGFLTAY